LLPTIIAGNGLEAKVSGLVPRWMNARCEASSCSKRGQARVPVLLGDAKFATLGPEMDRESDGEQRQHAPEFVDNGLTGRTSAVRR
jgi:hypothetical protein